MPELPEVETVCRQLAQSVVGKRIRNVVVFDVRVVKGIAPQALTGALKGKTIRSVRRRGKLIIVTLSPRQYLAIHLRINGWLILDPEPQRHARFRMELSNGDAIQFCDSRVLGEIRLVRDLDELAFLKRMGPEPLELSPGQFFRKFEGKKGRVKPLLMDQTFLAGIGNIYAQEALFCAGIFPARYADTLTQSELKNLYRCLKTVLRNAIRKRGTSARTYKQTDGTGGEYARCLCVYQRAGERCVRCAHEIVRESLSGRGTYFCPHCQT